MAAIVMVSFSQYGDSVFVGCTMSLDDNTTKAEQEGAEELARLLAEHLHHANDSVMHDGALH
jgi:hypothetical protein